MRAFTTNVCNSANVQAKTEKRKQQLISDRNDRSSLSSIRNINGAKVANNMQIYAGSNRRPITYLGSKAFFREVKDGVTMGGNKINLAFQRVFFDELIYLLSEVISQPC